MNERININSNWHKGVPEGLIIGTLDPKIIEQMPPPGIKLFHQLSAIEVLKNEIKLFLSGESNFLG